MRVLVVGAGGVGGYFGGRLVQKGVDVTFLVRPRRKQQLDQEGLIIHSVHGNASLRVKTLQAGDKSDPFDLILLSVKAYHLDEALHSLHPYVSKNTTILPLLNGISHLDKLKQMFGEPFVLGGLCFIESTLNQNGHIEHYSPQHDLVYGELDGEYSDRIKKIEQLFAGANLNAYASRHIIKRMWHKYIFISAMSGITSLTRSSLGPILTSPYGKEVLERLLHEIIAIAKTQEPSIDPDIDLQIMKTVTEISPTFKSSMQRDLEKGLPIETDHLHGTLLRLAPENLDAPLLKTVYSTLMIYEQSRT
ncbi:ketopantoate reductase family protein [Thermoflavimicrobium dichotomicum]|uniref:2-dehydropantoate 2-reductase n=1 Tax=Thermoflavimicrobium dichotomicum TaxID=46223 RepID=A0A1I3K5M4_9BACL|nr:ketopantoate reductase family protein [Thermoflavimicrobium dichotomicum]SFI67590.1 2-dehydropantoate 2-reductase [Thermoflavimicrobium dichotomicum]